MCDHPFHSREVRTTAVVGAALFLDMLVYGMVVPSLPAEATRTGASPAFVGVLFAAYGAGLLVATPVMGTLVDRFGGARLLFPGLVALSLATTCFAFAESPALLLTTRLLQGAAGAASWVAGLALVAEVAAPERTGRAMGVANACSAMGTLCGPVVGGFAAERVGMSAAFLGTALVVAIAAAACRLVLGTSKVAPSSRRDRPRPWRSPDVRAIAIVIASGAAVLGVLEPMLPLHFAARYGAGPALVGGLFAACILAYGMAAPLAGALADRAGPSRPIALGVVVTAVVLPLLALPRTLPVQVAAMALLGAAIAFFLTPTLRALATPATRASGAHGAAYAVYNVAYAGGVLFGAAAGGLLVDACGLGRALKIVGGGALAACSLPLRSLWAIDRLVAPAAPGLSEE